MKLRLAKLSDIDKIYNWRNDSFTRKMSQNKKLLNFSKHKDWFLEKINSDSTFFVIAFNNLDDLGVIRFDLESDFAVVNINVNPNFRNKKLSYKMLKSSIELFKKNRKVKYLKASINIANIASQIIFKRNGFIFSRNIDEFEIYVRKLD
tara:strand:- start:1285 stop:1731 length:447 start_codon:yes stop_codon:yes gene_type:complete